MPRKLKTYTTSAGFFDLAIAAPSMKAALEAWGSNSNLFQHGLAKETDDPKIVAATMARPGVVLRRPVGTDRAFAEHATLPSGFAAGLVGQPSAKRAEPPDKSRDKPPSKPAAEPIDELTARKAAQSFQRRAGAAPTSGAEGRSHPHQGARAPRSRHRCSRSRPRGSRAGAPEEGGRARQGARRARPKARSGAGPLAAEERRTGTSATKRPVLAP